MLSLWAVSQAPPDCLPSIWLAAGCDEILAQVMPAVADNVETTPPSM